MKRNAWKLMFAAAALTVAAGAASAQSMNADIPFAFRIGTDVYPAGSYRLDVANGLVRLSQWESRRTSMVLVTSSDQRAPSWTEAAASLAFECGIGRCQLTSVWQGADHRVLNLSRPGMGRDEHVALRFVRLTPAGD